jgi:probable selenium-dependent hydroxylase accessory protein YqeC
VVGAGGKTSAIFQLAKEFAAKGCRVVITTTTHMFREPGTLATTAKEAESLLKHQPIVITGRPAEAGKIEALENKDFQTLCGIADIVLVEADGSKHMPLKIPAAYEPVIPGNTDRVIVLAGLHGLGLKLIESCHREELVQKLLQAPPEHIMEEEDITVMLQKGYLEKKLLPAGFVGAILLNQADNTRLRNKAKVIAKALAPYPCIISQLKEE